MESGDFIRLLEHFKHPRFASIGVESTRFGNRPRKEVGLIEMGSVWTAPALVYYDRRNGQWLGINRPREWSLAMPRNSIPYLTLKNATWDDEWGRWTSNTSRFGPGEILRGWKPAIEQLLKDGFLRPDPHLSFLVGKDSRTLCESYPLI